MLQDRGYRGSTKDKGEAGGGGGDKLGSGDWVGEEGLRGVPGL